MNCWIEAPDKDAALEWGHALLGDYFKARYARSADGYPHNGSPISEGQIVDDSEMVAAAKDWNIPSCRVGEFPEWCEPWRFSNIRE